jgi:hypothetical protein
MKITFQTKFEDLNEELIDVEVTGNYYPGHTGTRNGFDRFAEPDEPADFEIDTVVEIETGREIFEEDNPTAWSKLIDEGIETDRDTRRRVYPLHVRARPEVLFEGGNRNLPSLVER